MGIFDDYPHLLKRPDIRALIQESRDREAYQQEVLQRALGPRLYHEIGGYLRNNATPNRTRGEQRTTRRVVDSHVVEVGSDSSYVYAKVVKVWDDGQVSIDSVDLRRYR